MATTKTTSDNETKKTVKLKELIPNWWGADRFI